MKRIIFIILAVGAIGLIAYYFFYFKNMASNPTPSPKPSASSSTTAVVSPTPLPQAQLAEPVKDFRARVTKKPFGINITPENSPVQPERFSGYHTGADAEYGDVTADVPVFAVADGTVTYSKWTSGYGGCFIMKIEIDGVSHSILYGHIRPSTLPNVGQQFKRGEQIAVLGTAYSTETDGERRHLHFAILSDNRVDVKGYVSNESQLSGWLDPLSFY